MTHPEPYGLYRALVRERPFAFDRKLGTWVAASAQAVRAVLSDPACRVRPVDEPVPSALCGTTAGDIFGRLVRMNDGSTHGSLKPPLIEAMRSIDRVGLRRDCARAVDHLLPRGIDAFALGLSVHVLGGWLGLSAAALDAVRDATERLVRGIAPGAQASQAQAADGAARELERWMREALAHPRPAPFFACLRASGLAPEVIVANAVGLFVQTHDATAGLIGNTLLALRGSAARGAQLAAIVEEVSRFDPPVHNTRRFVATDTTLVARAWELANRYWSCSPPPIMTPRPIRAPNASRSIVRSGRCSHSAWGHTAASAGSSLASSRCTA